MSKTIAKAEIITVLSAFGLAAIRGIKNVVSCVVSDNIWSNEGDLLSLECVSGDFFKKNCKTGDILLAASRGISSSGTRLLSQSPWTHAGLVCRANSLQNLNSTGENPELMVYEFGAHNPAEEVYNVCSKERRSFYHRDTVPRLIGSGIGLYSLDVFIMNYAGLYWYPLPDEDVSTAKRVEIRNVMENWLPLRNTPASPEFAGPPEVLRSLILPSWLVGTSLSTKVWCSTVVPLVLSGVGVMNLTKDVNAYLPGDLADVHTWLSTCPHMTAAPKYVLGLKTDILKF